MLRGVADDHPASTRRLHNLHANAVRMVARQTKAFYDDYHRLRTAGILTIPVLTSDSYESPSMAGGYAEQTAAYARVYSDVPIWLVGNEWNIAGDASFPQGHDAFVDFWNLVAPTLPPGTRYVGGYFMVDGATLDLYTLLQRLSPRPDGVDLHPYLDTSPTFEETTNWLQEAGFRVSVAEWNDSHAASLKAFQRTMDALDVVASMFLPWKTSPFVDNLPGLVSPRTDRLTALGRAYREVLGE